MLVACTGLTVLADSASNEAKFEYNRGYDFYKIGQYDRSMAAFRRAIEIDPNYIDAYYNLGSILEYLHQDDAALAVFECKTWTVRQGKIVFGAYSNEQFPLFKSAGFNFDNSSR